MAKRGFSKMMWGGVIILVAVLFFVSVYGVREGFKNTQCVAEMNYAEPTAAGAHSFSYYTEGCMLKPSGTAGNNRNHRFFAKNAYYGIPGSDGKLTQFKAYQGCQNTDGNWTWETSCSR